MLRRSLFSLICAVAIHLLACESGGSGGGATSTPCPNPNDRDRCTCNAFTFAWEGSPDGATWSCTSECWSNHPSDAGLAGCNNEVPKASGPPTEVTCTYFESCSRP